MLEENPDIGVVCGRRRERFPESTVYNHLADLEWDSPVGEAKACGGDAMMRVEAVRKVGGYNPAIIAAEDDEVCLRIRREGWKVVRIDAEMTLHDMAMTSFRQWWRRSTRTGHAYAEGSAMYGQTPERHFVRQTRSAIFWGILLPLAALGLAWPTRGAQPYLAGRILPLVPPNLPLLRGPARLAARRCSSLRILDCPGQVSSCAGSNPILAWSAFRSGEARSSNIAVPTLSESRQQAELTEDHVHSWERSRTLKINKAVQPIRVGFLGTGYIADWHAKALSTIASRFTRRSLRQG